MPYYFFYGIDVGNMGVDFMNDAGNMDKALLVWGRNFAYEAAYSGLANRDFRVVNNF